MSAPTPRSQRSTAFASSDSIGRSSDSSPLDAAWGACQRWWQWARSEEARDAARALVADVAEGGLRVIGSIRLPTREGLVEFFTHQILVNVAGWMAGLVTAHVVTRLFEVRGFRNLWGLAGSGDRTLVSADDYRLIMTITGFTIGLLTMLFVRHFLMRWISETRTLRAERGGLARSEQQDRPVSSGPPATHFDVTETDHD